jgi:hypothetical protein
MLYLSISLSRDSPFEAGAADHSNEGWEYSNGYVLCSAHLLYRMGFALEFRKVRVSARFSIFLASSGNRTVFA